MSHRWTIEYLGDDGRTLGCVAVEPRWELALQAAAFAAMRRGRAPLRFGAAAGRVEPAWHAERGPPHVAALRAIARGPEGDLGAETVPLTYLRPLAEQGASSLVTRGVLSQGERFHFRVYAWTERGAAPRGPAPGAEPPADLAAEDASPEHAPEARDLEALLAGAAPVGTGEDGDFPVLLPEPVLADAFALARGAGALESGGVLLGQLRRAAGSPELFLEVTALVPARHATATAMRFTFTPETWAAARTAASLRGAGELLCGWCHSHPHFCRACPAERRRACAWSTPFFSPEDVHLHRTCFPAPFQVALLVSDLGAQGLVANVFGWRRGSVSERSAHVLGAAGHRTAACAP